MRLGTKQFLDKWLGNFLLFFNLGLARGLGLLLRRNHTVSKPPSTIVYIKILGIGSVYMAADAIYSLKQTYPACRHVLLCNKGVRTGVLPMQLFDDILVIDDSSFSTLLRSGMVALFRCIAMPNSWVADLEVYSKLTTMFSLYTLARNRFGFSFRDVSFRDYLNTHNIYFNQFVVVEENYNAMARAMGAAQIVSFEFKQYPVRKHRGLMAGKVLLNNTCSELSKERLLKKSQVVALVVSLAGMGYQVYLSGSPADAEENEEYIKQLPQATVHAVHNIAGKLKFDEFVQFMYTDCTCVLTVDSAPLHIARKLGVPTLSVWGPSHPGTRIVQTELHRAIYLHVPCSPCVHLVEELPCKGNNFCIKDISAEQIIASFDTLIKAIA
jgi:ADP-heptose:LPS heptosyltransferase